MSEAWECGHDRSVHPACLIRACVKASFEAQRHRGMTWQEEAWFEYGLLSDRLADEIARIEGGATGRDDLRDEFDRRSL